MCVFIFLSERILDWSVLTEKYLYNIMCMYKSIPWMRIQNIKMPKLNCVSWNLYLQGYEIILYISCMCVTRILKRRIQDLKMPILNCVSWIFCLQGYEISLYISCVCVTRILKRRIWDFKMPILNCVSWIFCLQGYEISLYIMCICNSHP